MRLFENTSYDFWALHRIGFIFSGVSLLASLVLLVTPGLQAGIDFRGGTEMIVSLQRPINFEAAREALVPVLGTETEVKAYGSDRELLVRSAESGDTQTLQQRTEATLLQAFPDARPAISRTDTIGPRFADDLYRGALYSVLGGLLVVLLYVLARYDWRFGVGAVLTLGHDVVVILGIFAFLNAFTPVNLTITQTIVAALLTIIGYSVNDTVIIFDRIRETLGLYRTEAFSTVANRAINATLSRTIITSGTTLVSVVVLLFLGGEELRGFALALFIGILLGTYSSIFVSAPIVVVLRERFPVHKKAVRAMR